jgi:hypothetical protein
MFLLDWKVAKPQCSFSTAGSKINGVLSDQIFTPPLNLTRQFHARRVVSQRNLLNLLNINRWYCLLDHDRLYSQIRLKTVFPHLFPASTLLEPPKWRLNVREMRRIDRNSARINLC